MDFYLTEPAYWDLELYGQIWDDYCNPEAIKFNQKFSTTQGHYMEGWCIPTNNYVETSQTIVEVV